MRAFSLTINAIDNVLEFDYIEAMNTYMDAVEQVCFIAFGVIGIVWDFLGFMWHNGGKSAAVKAVAWFRNCAVPFITDSMVSVYQSGEKARHIWEMLNSPLFIIL